MNSSPKIYFENLMNEYLWILQNFLWAVYSPALNLWERLIKWGAIQDGVLLGYSFHNKMFNKMIHSYNTSEKITSIWYTIVYLSVQCIFLYIKFSQQGKHRSKQLLQWDTAWYSPTAIFNSYLVRLVLYSTFAKSSKNLTFLTP